MRKILLLGAIAVLATAGVARAEGVADLIPIRGAAMALMSGDFAGIRAVVAAKGDVKTLEGPAKAMARFATVIPTLFPKGTETPKVKPEIWSDMAGFQKAAAAMGEEATKLAELAKAGDADKIGDQIKALGGTCAACHNAYRPKT